MGLLDDMVKLNFGKPLSEALWSIKQGVLERSVQEQAAPILEDFANRATRNNTSAINPESLATDTNKTLADLLKIPGATQTEAYKTISQSVANIANQGIEAYAKGAEGKYHEAAASHYQAAAAETRAQTSHLDRQLTPADVENIDYMFPTKEAKSQAVASAKEGGLTMRQLLNISKAEEPYIRLAETKLSLKAASDQMNKALDEERWKFMTGFVLPELGWQVTDISNPQKLKNAIAGGDYNSVIKDLTGVAAKREGIGPNDVGNKEWKALFEKTRDSFTRAMTKYGSTMQASASNALTGRMAAYWEVRKSLGTDAMGNPAPIRKEIDDELRGQFGLPPAPGPDPKDKALADAIAAYEAEKKKAAAASSIIPPSPVKNIDEFNAMQRRQPWIK